MKKFISTIFLIITFFLTQITSLPVGALGSVNWLLVKENQLGKEWLDLGSLKILNENELTVLTRFFENPSKEKDKGETFLYVMRINCLNKEFRDISRNGIPNLNSKWETSKNDELIESVINESCSRGI